MVTHGDVEDEVDAAGDDGDDKDGPNPPTPKTFQRPWALTLSVAAPERSICFRNEGPVTLRAS